MFEEYFFGDYVQNIGGIKQLEFVVGVVDQNCESSFICQEINEKVYYLMKQVLNNTE